MWHLFENPHWKKYKEIAAVRGALLWLGWWGTIVSVISSSVTFAWARFSHLAPAIQWLAALGAIFVVLGISALLTYLIRSYGKAKRPLDAAGKEWINPIEAMQKARLAVSLLLLLLAFGIYVGRSHVTKAAKPQQSEEEKSADRQPDASPPKEPVKNESKTNKTSDTSSKGKVEAKGKITSQKRDAPSDKKAQPQPVTPSTVTGPVTVSAPNGIANAPGGTITNPTVNNYGPPLPRLTWRIEERGQRPTLKDNAVFLWLTVDRSLDVPAFVAQCDRPCKTTEGGANLVTGGVNYLASKDPNVVGLTFKIPRPLGAGIEVYWSIESMDATPVKILGVEILPANDLPAAMR